MAFSRGGFGFARAASTRCSAAKTSSLASVTASTKRSTAHLAQSRSAAVAMDTHASGLDTASASLVQRINSCSTRMVLYAYGGALQATTWLMSSGPGLNKAPLLEVLLPQDHGSLTDITGQALQPWCSETAALALARAAYQRAAHLSAFGTPILGVSVASEPSLPGGRCTYVAVHGKPQGPSLACIQLTQPGPSRLEEDVAVSKLVLKILADALDHAPSSLQGGGGQQAASAGAMELMGVSQVQGTESPIPAVVSLRQIPVQSPLEALMEGRVRCVEFNGDQVVVDAPRRNKIYLPGSFNPLHAGHRQLLDVARRLNRDKEAAFELSIGNPDKGVLPLEETERRIQQFRDAHLPVVVTCAPLFPDKSTMFPDSVFVLGYDTAKRLVMPKYYGDSELNMLLQFARLRHCGCKFLVAGRCDPQTKQFLTLKDVEVPLGLVDLFADIDESEFRVDLSSTELRAQMIRSEPLGSRPSGASRVDG